MKLASGQLLLNQPLADLTSWQIGGPAKQFYSAIDLADLQKFLSQLPKDEELFWLGLGSNVLIRDQGFDGTVIHTLNALKKCEWLPEKNMIRAEAGVACPTLARFCARQNFASGEFWCGIPGTVGGALRMNAGAFGSETWEYIIAVETIDRYGQIHIRSPQDFQIAYRSVIAKNPDEWFIAAHICLPVGDKNIALEKIRKFLDQRAATQPTGEKNCGSVFRNPEGNYAGRLIEQLGLKNFRIGGAFISEKHANFMINEGSATAKDMELLIQYAKECVFNAYGIDLHCEVHMIGK